MMPGVNPRQLKQMMKQMGMTQDEVEALEVIIKTPDKLYVFENPSVQKIVMHGQESFQLTGTYRLEDVKIEVSISEDDVVMVSEQAQVSKDEARKALEDTNGDIAEAIVNLSNK